MDYGSISSGYLTIDIGGDSHVNVTLQGIASSDERFPSSCLVSVREPPDLQLQSSLPKFRDVQIGFWGRIPGDEHRYNLTFGTHWTDLGMWMRRSRLECAAVSLGVLNSRSYAHKPIARIGTCAKRAFSPAAQQPVC
jgi:hypothetical protein